MGSQVTLLNKDQPAPYTGVLFDVDYANELKQNAERVKNYKLVIDSYERSVSLYKENEGLLNSSNKVLLDQNDKLAKRLNEARSTSLFETVGIFVLGAACATLIAYGASKVVR